MARLVFTAQGAQDARWDFDIDSYEVALQNPAIVVELTATIGDAWAKVVEHM
jgi:hypothetical protein